MRQQRAAQLLVFLLSALAVCSSVTVAAPQSVDPLLRRFDDGFGLVLASVLICVDETPEDPTDNALRVTFRTEEVIAAPTIGRPNFPWNVAPKTELTVRMSVGVHGTISSWYDPGDKGEPVVRYGPPGPGARFVLSVRPLDPKKPGFMEHADGPAAAEPLLRLPDDRRQMFSAVQSLALMTLQTRLAKCRDIVIDRKASDALRGEVVRYLSMRSVTAAGKETPEAAAIRAAERRDAIAALWAAWNDPLTHWSDESIAALEAGLRLLDGATFDDSDDRRATLLNHVLAAPPAGNATEVKAKLSRRPVLSLAAAAGSNPAQLGWPLVRALSDERWPISYRVMLADVLLRIREQSVGPEPGWVLAVDQFVVRAADKSDPDDIRLLAGLMSYWLGTEEGNPPRRAMKASGAMRAALASAERRTTIEATRRPDDQFIRTTVTDLRRIVRFIDNADTAAVAGPPNPKQPVNVAPPR